MRTIDWAGDHIVAIDQTKLPDAVARVEITSIDLLVDAIHRLAIRGAPALGAAGGLGVALAAIIADRDGGGRERVVADVSRLRSARPTAVNLAWGVDRVLAHLGDGTPAVVAEAVSLLEEDIATNRALARRGADFVLSTIAPPVRVHTHCNAGGLACVEWGTALGIVRELNDRGALTMVVTDETRPLLQGTRLTAFELAELGIDYRIVVDGAAPSVIARGLVDVVIVGADRIAANGDVANKIGTYPLALAAARRGIPFVVAAPESTVDVATATGADIHVEERAESEVLCWLDARAAPVGARALNPAFDVTPADLVTAIVTERRVILASAGEHVGGAR